MVAIITVTTAVVDGVMHDADATTVKPMVQSRNQYLSLSLILSRWHGLVQTGEAKRQVAVIAQDVVAISHRPVMRRKMLRPSNSRGSLKLAKSGVHVSATRNRPLVLVRMSQ